MTGITVVLFLQMGCGRYSNLLSHMYCYYYHTRQTRSSIDLIQIYLHVSLTLALHNTYIYVTLTCISYLAYTILLTCMSYLAYTTILTCMSYLAYTTTLTCMSYLAYTTLLTCMSYFQPLTASSVRILVNDSVSPSL